MEVIFAEAIVILPSTKFYVSFILSNRAQGTGFDFCILSGPKDVKTLAETIASISPTDHIITGPRFFPPVDMV